jgi:hypothetical protein
MAAHLALLSALACGLPAPRFRLARPLSAAAVRLGRPSFDRALRGAVHFSAEAFNSEVFADPKQISDSSGLFTFTGCLFSDCQSSGNGGALAVGHRVASSARLRVQKCGFSGCGSQKQGGAIFAQCTDFDLSRSCVDDCSARQYSAIFESSSTGCSVADFWLAGIRGQADDAAVSVDSDEPTVRACNFTGVSSRDGRAVLLSDGPSISVAQAYFTACQLDTVLALEEGTKPLKTVNFVKNAAKSELVRVSGWRTTMENCAFVKDNSNAVINGYVLLKDCVFSDAYDAGLFPESCTKDRCSFGVGWKTRSFDIVASSGCWALRAERPGKVEKPGRPEKPPRDKDRRKEKPDEENDKDDKDDEDEDDDEELGEVKRGTGWMWVLMVLSVLVIVGVGFVAFKWWRRRDQGGALLRMYSQV